MLFWMALLPRGRRLAVAAMQLSYELGLRLGSVAHQKPPSFFIQGWIAGSAHKGRSAGPSHVA